MALLAKYQAILHLLSHYHSLVENDILINNNACMKTLFKIMLAPTNSKMLVSMRGIYLHTKVKYFNN